MRALANEPRRFRAPLLLAADRGVARDVASPAVVDNVVGDAGGGLPVIRVELIGLIAITVAAAVLRFAYVASGGPWDLDQGTEMLAIWTALTSGHLPLFGPAATSLESTFHHGALYYDLLLPAAWLSHGDPRAVLAEIAAVNTPVVPMLWWVARSIGGRATGLIVALMAAASADLVFFSSFIWNPTFIEPGAALGILGAWQAWRTRNPRWWLAAAAGVTLAAQAHVAAAVLALPLGAAFLLDLKRASNGARSRIALWGLASGTLIMVTYLPVIYHELTSDFSEIRGMASYVSSPPGYVSASPVARLVFAAIRLPAWPLTGWPFFELRPGVLLALAVTLAMAVALPLLLLQTWRHGSTISGNQVPAADERHGLAFVAGGLGLVVITLGLGVRAVSELNLTMTEQYHTAADPFVLLAAAIALGAIWQGRRIGKARYLGRTVAIVLMALFVGFNAVHWPPITPDGSWTDAQAAASRIERDAAGGQIALVPLYEPKGIDAYSYPLTRDGITLVTPNRASTVVLLCDSGWIAQGCGGGQEEEWRSSHSGSQTLTLIDRFNAAPDRIMSVYRRSP